MIIGCHLGVRSKAIDQVIGLVRQVVHCSSTLCDIQLRQLEVGERKPLSSNSVTV